MSMIRNRIITVALCAAWLLTSPLLIAQEDVDPADSIYPIAILPFQERGAAQSTRGPQVTDLLFAKLVVNPDLYLVEREEIQKLQDETELNLSGLVSPGQAIQVGHLTGAKIIVTGSIVTAGNHQYLIAKIIGTETSRVLGASSKGEVGDDIDKMVKSLASRVTDTLLKRSSDLVASPKTQNDQIEDLRVILGKGKRPSVWIDVEEQHIGQSSIDPAAETEMTTFCTELGFTVIDRKSGKRSDADVAITGEAISQFASRRGDLTSVRGRVEVNAVDTATGAVLAADRQVAVAVDLAEQLAGKAALQDAAGEIAFRLLPKIAMPKKGRRK